MKNIAILAVVAIALLTFGYITLFSTPAQKMADEAVEVAAELSLESASTTVVSAVRQGSGSLEMLRLLGEDLECTVVYIDSNEETTVEGTYFVSAGNMRGDFLTPTPDLSGQVLSSMIINDSYFYVWTEIEGQSYGIKTDLSLPSDATLDAREPVPLDDIVMYNCKPWKNVDRTVFVPPSTVLFQDSNELMQGGMEYGTIYEELEI
ncbi:MAG: hypothetical protein RL097_717 [Candidatus Parcubacteria bacterium]